MGKGDRKTAKGKRFNSSYGNARKTVSTGPVIKATPVVKKATKTATKTVAKAPAKKAVAKKAAAKQ